MSNSKVVLSLFDGISCGQLALKVAGVDYNEYYASEINPYAMRITQHHFPNTFQLGDVTKLDIENLPKNVFLLFAGFPCQDMSKANTKERSGLYGERSKLFWEIIRIIGLVNPRFFIIENVMMDDEWVEIISGELGVRPIIINSNLLSAQNRIRLYWTNIPGVTLPSDRRISISDIIYDDSYKVFTLKYETLQRKKVGKNCIKWDLNGRGYYSQPHRAYFKSGKMCTISKGTDFMNIVVDCEKNIYRRIHPIEAERCQTLPDRYTEVRDKIGKISNRQRFIAIGNAWTVDVIAHLLSFLPKD